VVEHGRRALMIAGDGHLWRRSPGPATVQLLDSSDMRVFAISTPTQAEWASLQADEPSWSIPAVLPLAWTALGVLRFVEFLPIPQERYASVTMAEQADALLYLGPASTMTTSRLAPERCADLDYLEMRLGRMAIATRLPGAPDPVERIRQYCAAVAPR